jgi:hypothetical protein
MSNHTKERKLGQNMKPRTVQAVVNGEVKEVSTNAVQEETPVEVTAETAEPEVEGGGLADGEVQNLDSSTVSLSVSDSGSFESEKEEAASDVPEATEYPVLVTQAGEDLLAAVLTPPSPPELPQEAFDLAKALQDSVGHLSGAQVIAENKTEETVVLQVRDVPFFKRMGLRPDGSFGIVVSVGETWVETVMQWSEANDVTPEEWLSGLLASILESYGDKPRGR